MNKMGSRLDPHPASSFFTAPLTNLAPSGPKARLPAMTWIGRVGHDAAFLSRP
jgi:hypothetical protein